MLSDHAWLWARGYDGGGPHTDLLRRLSHWLMKEPDLEEERLIASAKGLKLTIERRSMEDSVPQVQVSAPGGENSEVTLEKAGPGIWRSTVDVKVPGLYKLQTQSPTGPLHAVAHAGIEDAREMSEVTATDEKLKPLVESTGGGTFWTRGGGLLSSVSTSSVEVPRISMLANARVLAGSGWLGLKDREAYVTRGVKLIPMFTGLTGAGSAAGPVGGDLVARGAVGVGWVSAATEIQDQIGDIDPRVTQQSDPSVGLRAEQADAYPRTVLAALTQPTRW